jgi:glycosyltransferase involved in cell wall biosynthesis
MNILMINYEYPPLGGGGGVFNKQLAEELTKTDEVTVITSIFGNQKTHEIINDVEIVRVPVAMRKDQNAASIVSMLSFFPSSLKMGKKLLRERTFDIVHSMFAIPSAPSGLALAKKFKIPHVLSILGGDIYDPSKTLSPHKTPMLHFTVKKVMEKSDRVVALSRDIQRRAAEYYSISKQIDLIYLGIPKPSVIPKSREHFGFSPNDILLVTIGRLVPRKSVSTLIKIVAGLENPKIKLLVVGDGPERGNLEELTKSLDLEKRICFSGKVTDEEKFQLLNISDVFVSSSQHEGFGIVFLEAMATGLPVVCYDKGGQADFLQNGRTGYLTPHGSQELLSNNILKLCEDISLKENMRQFNQEYMDNFYVGTCADKYRCLYSSIIEKT